MLSREKLEPGIMFLIIFVRVKISDSTRSKEGGGITISDLPNSRGALNPQTP